MVKGDGFMETVAFVNISLRKYQRWPFCTKTTTGMIAINGEKAYLKPWIWWILTITPGDGLDETVVFG